MSELSIFCSTYNKKCHIKDLLQQNIDISDEVNIMM